MFWPRQIWSKYVNKLEVCIFKNLFLLSPFILCLSPHGSWLNLYDLTDVMMGKRTSLSHITCIHILYFFPSELHMYNFCFIQCNILVQDLKEEVNSVKAVQCLNDMVTNALMHVEDCLLYMANLRDLSIFRFCAIPQVLFFFSVISSLIVTFIQWSFINIQQDFCLNRCFAYMSMSSCSIANSCDSVNNSFILNVKLNNLNCCDGLWISLKFWYCQNDLIILIYTLHALGVFATCHGQWCCGQGSLYMAWLTDLVK